MVVRSLSLSLSVWAGLVWPGLAWSGLVWSGLSLSLVWTDGPLPLPTSLHVKACGPMGNRVPNAARDDDCVQTMGNRVPDAARDDDWVQTMGNRVPGAARDDDCVQTMDNRVPDAARDDDCVQTIGNCVPDAARDDDCSHLPWHQRPAILNIVVTHVGAKHYLFGASRVCAASIHLQTS